MKLGGIDSNRIEAMLAQLKAAAAQSTQPSAGVNGIAPSSILDKTQSTQRIDFSDALKASLDQVNNAQMQADKLGQNFAMGDDKVSLSDVMISMQKANISFQTTIQVRNKLVSAYHDIMNMQV